MSLQSILSLLRDGVRDRWTSLPDDVFSAIVEGAQEGVLVADIRSPDAQIIYVNSAFEAITGYSRSEAKGKNCRYLQGSDRLQPQIAVIRKAIAAGTEAHVRIRNYRKDGSLFWNDLSVVPIRSADDMPTHYVGFIRDVTEVVSTADSLDRILRMDQLTGCLNRDAFVEQLSVLAASTPILLIKLDIARFHEVNSGYGFDQGDTLLKAIADRLRTLSADLLARIGNDQFALTFAISGDTDSTLLVGKVSRLLDGRFALPGADLKIRFAMGFVLGDAGSDAMTLVRQAGAALAESKSSLLRQACEFSSERQAAADHRLQMTAELQRALSSDAFTYHYQPQVDLQTGEIIGAEALVRWRHPLFGLQLPGKFIHLAEETGIILDIGASGLRDVAQFACAVNRGRETPLGFSFNVSAVEISHRDMISFVRRVVSETGIEPAWLTLELTESLLAVDSPEMLSIFHGLRELGIGLSIDDFGTGYSSLRYLERFPLTEIKIDRSFVSGLANSTTKRVIVEAVIKLGSELGVRVIGEGISQEAEREALASMGCAFGQGFLFSTPLEADEFKARLG